MKKIDGKEYYTFVGLINRMDACRDRDYKFTEKDIPEEVEFADTIYKLDADRTFYYDPNTGVTLAEVVGEVYGMNMFKFLTEHVFIVTPKEKVFLTSEEKEFIRMCNKIGNTGNGIVEIEIHRPVWSDVMELVMYCDTSCRKIDLRPGMFSSLEHDKRYTLKELRIYD